MKIYFNNLTSRFLQSLIEHLDLQFQLPDWEYYYFIPLGGSIWLGLLILKYYFSHMKPWLLERKCHKYKMFLDDGFAVIKKKWVRRSDGSLVEKKISIHLPKVIRHKFGFEIIFYSDSVTLSMIESKLELFSNFFDEEILNVRKKGPRRFIFETNNLPRQVAPKVGPENSIHVGVNNLLEDVFVSVRENFSWLFVGGTGSGKTYEVVSKISSFLKSVRGQVRVVIFDYKGLDYSSFLKAHRNAIFFDMTTLEGMRQASAFLAKTIQEFSESKRILQGSEFIHYDDARAVGIKLPLEKTLFVFDEASQYLQVQQWSKEHKEVTSSLVSQVATILSTFRISGCPIFVATQRVQKDELDIPYENFLVQFFSSISKEMDDKYREGRFYRMKLGKGLWTVNTTEVGVTLVRTPFQNDLFSAPQFEQDDSATLRPGPPSDFIKSSRGLIVEYACRLNLSDSFSVFLRPEIENFFQTLSADQKSEVLQFLLGAYGEGHEDLKAVQSVFNQHCDNHSRPHPVKPQFTILSTHRPHKKKYEHSHVIVRVREESTGREADIFVPKEEAQNFELIFSKFSGTYAA